MGDDGIPRLLQLLIAFRCDFFQIPLPPSPLPPSPPPSPLPFLPPFLPAFLLSLSYISVFDFGFSTVNEKKESSGGSSGSAGGDDDPLGGMQGVSLSLLSPCPRPPTSWGIQDV